MTLASPGRVVFDTLLPANADTRLPRGLLETGFDAFYVEFTREAPPLVRTALPLAILSATWIAPLLIAKLPPLGRLSRDDRERALVAMSRSRIGLLRQLVVLLKLVAAMSYGADDGVRDAIGYGGERTA